VAVLLAAAAQEHFGDKAKLNFDGLPRPDAALGGDALAMGGEVTGDM